MMAITSWAALHDAFRRIPATGVNGFEGFVANLFEAETGDRYYVAATGDQPSGDARDEAGGVALQTKAYFGTTRFNKNEAIAQLYRAIHALPELEVYVLAATKDSAQLKDELAWAAREFAVDVLLLHLGPHLTQLNALAVSHWDIVKKFISGLDNSSDVWANEQSASIEVKSELAKLRNRLNGTGTRTAFQRLSHDSLCQRVAVPGTGDDGFNPIDLGQAVLRHELVSKLQTWWHSSTPENAVLVGDEGMGKTWVAAAFANNLSKRQATIVLWLDSASWRLATSVIEVLERALKTVVMDDQVSQYRRRILHRWSGTVLIVLDGANESNAWQAARRVLKHYFLHLKAFRGRVRLLFTGRPFSPLSVGHGDFWRNSRQIHLQPFSLAELDEGLRRFAPEITAATIPAETREFIRIPLYFRIFLRYRHRLASLHHLDKRVLLWIEIQEKFGNPLGPDPQFAAIRRATEADLSEVLAELAQSLSFPVNGEPTVPMAEIHRCIPGFRDVRDDLQAKKIIIGNDLTFARWSLDHAIVALGLLLQREAQRHASKSLDALHDLLRAKLEPLPSTDDKARALHVAVLLSFIHPAGRTVRASLLTLWLPQRNADLCEDELSFFVAEDFEAYVVAVEWLFRKFLRGDFETTLIAPLCRKWAQCGVADKPLVDVLERWLRLVFPGDASGSKNRDTAPPPDFPVAASEPQLRLSYAAISVMSFRPEVSLLPALLDCYRSHAFCYQDSGGPGEKFRVLVKDAYDHLGILLRWHLDEREWIDAFAEFAGRFEADGEDMRKIRNFARNLRVASLPVVLGVAEDIYVRRSDGAKNSVDYLRLVLNGEEGPPLNYLSFEGFARDAVRRDLPALTDSEGQRLVQFAQEFVRQHPLKIPVHNTFEQQIFVHLLPWVARYSPAAYGRLIVDYALLGVGAKNPAEVFLELDGIIPVHESGSEIVAAIFERMPALLDLETLSGFIGEMTEAILLHGNAEQIRQWTEWLAIKPHPRGGSHVSWLPLPTAFRNYAPVEFFTVARENAASAIDALHRDPSDELSVHSARHWLHLACYAPRETESAEWAFSMLNRLPPNRELEWPVVYFLVTIPDVEVLRRTLRDERVRRFLQTEVGGLLVLRLINNPQSEKLEPSEIDRLPLSAAGLIHWRCDDAEGLGRWGRRLSIAALAFVKAAPPQTTIVHRSHRNADADGLMHGFGVDIPSGGYSRSHFRGSSAWGVDRHSESAAATEEEVDRLFEEFHHDLDRLREWAGSELAGFNASPALSRWVELEPAAFARFAETFFTQLETAGIKTFEAMGTVAWCIAVAMVKSDPRRALTIVENWQADWSFRVVTLGGLCTAVVARIWSSECDAAPGIAQLRRELCDRALTDEEIFVQVLSASRGGSRTEIIAIAKERLASSRARDRALATTLLAFIDQDGEVRDLLQPTTDGDESYWVRDQAEWALEASAIEASCRMRYLSLLQPQQSLERLATGLAELRPALTPLARAWRFDVEKVAGWKPGTDRISTYLELFWYHWECHSESHRDVKIAGRKLKDYCRGEKLKDGVSSRMTPWWSLDAL